MSRTLTKVLLVEDNPGDADLIQALFSEVEGSCCEVDTVDRLLAGLKRLALGGIDVVLLDLSLPDSQGLAALHAVHNQSPAVPIVVLTGLDDETVAVEAVQQGAQDYLVKGQVDGNLLVRAIRYAIERAKSKAALRETNRLIQQIVDILYFYDAREQRIVYSSPRFAELLGLTTQQMEKTRPSLPRDLVHPDDCEQHAEHVERLLRTQDDSVLEHEYRIKAADGQWRWLCTRETVFGRDGGGSATLIIGSAQDVTERKRLEEEVTVLNETLSRLVKERGFSGRTQAAS